MTLSHTHKNAHTSSLPASSWSVNAMETNGVASYRHRRTPSSDRFLNVFSPPSSGVMSGGSSADGDELNEDDIFWTGDFTEPKRQSPASDAFRNGNNGQNSLHRQSFRQQSERSGIFAALQDDSRKPNRPVLYRKASISPASSPTKSALTASSSRIIPAIPRPPHERDYVSQSMPMRKFQQSAPVNVPVFSRKVTNIELADVDIGEEEEEEEMLPPHEIVARGSSKSPKTTNSVLEGVGRTLKGRDLRLVRNAVFRRTGFLD